MNQCWRAGTKSLAFLEGAKTSKNNYSDPNLVNEKQLTGAKSRS